MDDSILNDIKDVLGITPDQVVFDQAIMMYLNAEFATLTQLGVGPNDGVFVSNEEDLWASLGLPPKLLNLTKTYLYLKVRMQFDPPDTGYYMTAMSEQIKQTEWRLTVMRDEIAAEEATA